MLILGAIIDGIHHMQVSGLLFLYFYKAFDIELFISKWTSTGMLCAKHQACFKHIHQNNDELLIIRAIIEEATECRCQSHYYQIFTKPIVNLKPFKRFENFGDHQIGNISILESYCTTKLHQDKENIFIKFSSKTCMSTL